MGMKYYYDPESCRYRPWTTGVATLLWRGMGVLVCSAFMTGLVCWGYVTHFESNKEHQLKEENERLRQGYTSLKEDLSITQQTLAALQDRDDALYRLVLDASPLPATVRRAGIGGGDLQTTHQDGPQIMNQVRQHVDQLKRALHVQSKSYDELEQMARKREQRLAAIPAIQPLHTRSLRQISSGFGMRIHPIHKVHKMHSGIDIVAPRGTPVHATGDGIVKRAAWAGSYGNLVEIEHGYGYTTRYAHLASYNTRAGQRVKRGQCIGYVGTTGGSTGLHLHYEVLKDKKFVNPVHYFAGELTPEQYTKVLKLAARPVQSLS